MSSVLKALKKIEKEQPSPDVDHGEWLRKVPPERSLVDRFRQRLQPHGFSYGIWVAVLIFLIGGMAIIFSADFFQSTSLVPFSGQGSDSALKLEPVFNKKEQDKKEQDKKEQDKKEQDKNQQDKNQQDKNQQDKNQQDKNQQDKSVQDKSAQDKSAQGKNIQGKNIQGKNIQGKNIQGKNIQGRVVSETVASDQGVAIPSKIVSHGQDMVPDRSKKTVSNSQKTAIVPAGSGALEAMVPAPKPTKKQSLKKKTIEEQVTRAIKEPPPLISKVVSETVSGTPGSDGEYNAEVLKDSTMKVQAISWNKSPSSRLAVIGNHVVRQGDQIEQYMVIQINQGDIILGKDGKRWKILF